MVLFRPATASSPFVLSAPSIKYAHCDAVGMRRHSVDLFCNIQCSRYLSFYPRSYVQHLYWLLCLDLSSEFFSKSYRTMQLAYWHVWRFYSKLYGLLGAMASGGTVEIPRRTYILIIFSYFPASHLSSRHIISYLASLLPVYSHRSVSSWPES